MNNDVLIIAIGVTQNVQTSELLDIATAGSSAISIASFGELLGTLQLVGTAMCSGVTGESDEL